VNIEDIIQAVDGSVICGAGSPATVQYGFASDLMSDVLTITADSVLLITGLASIQTIRTAIVADIGSILFVRNKRVTSDMSDLAAENGLILISTTASMFKSSGILFARGLKPVY
jgi:hypothetical protein